MDIRILGPGCKNCVNLEQRTRDAAAEVGIDATYTKVTEYADIAGYGVMKTPALVVDGQVMVTGRVPSIKQLRELLTAAAN